MKTMKNSYLHDFTQKSTGKLEKTNMHNICFDDKLMKYRYIRVSMVSEFIKIKL